MQLVVFKTGDKSYEFIFGIFTILSTLKGALSHFYLVQPCLTEWHFETSWHFQVHMIIFAALTVVFLFIC